MLELKKVRVGNIESVPINIEKLDISVYKQEDEDKKGKRVDAGLRRVKIPNVISNSNKSPIE